MASAEAETVAGVRVAERVEVAKAEGETAVAMEEGWGEVEMAEEVRVAEETAEARVEARAVAGKVGAEEEAMGEVMGEKTEGVREEL